MKQELLYIQSLAKTGQTAQALQLLEPLKKQYPRNIEIWLMQGALLGNSGRFKEAVECFRQVNKIKPRNVQALINLANALNYSGEVEQAISTYSKALKLAPKNTEILAALAKTQASRGRFKEAIQFYKRNLRLQPQKIAINQNIAACYFLGGELEQAEKYYRRSLKYQQNASCYDGLGATLCQQGKYQEAVDAHHQALRLEPGNACFHSNYLLSLNYLAEFCAVDLLNEHIKWGERHRFKVGLSRQYTNTIQKDRLLRIGYVSPDFRTHSVAYFLEPLLVNHDKNKVEVFCYACTPHQDETTGRFQKVADYWRDISNMDDSQAASQIMNDKIDILVDLSGHTARNRLTLFGYKPAPVQVTWLGYPATTGLDTMDYRLTDEFADLPGNDVFYTEQLLRLKGCFLCYKPPATCPAVSPAPVEKNGLITFGSFNNLAKINETVVKQWAELLHYVSDSHILIKNPSLSDKASRKRYLAMFCQLGILPERVELRGLVPTLKDHLDTYSRIDIALDTFPYNGTTTTCEALYMGVPVITLAGKVHASCVGKSLLTAVGTEELIANSSEVYINIAKALANDAGRIINYRKTLRQQMQDSPLCDGAGFARKIELVYKDIWQKWCQSQIV